VTGAWGPDDLIEKAFDLHEYTPGDVFEVGSMRVSFHPVPHFLPTNAVEIASADGGGRITYGADHRPSEEIVEFARDTDLLLMEATLPRPEREGDRGHMTPREAGEHAKAAGAKRLVLIHISDELDQLWARDCAAEAFGEDVRVAAIGDVYTV
jgi:ribonuclease BN (tRNA processing enzyme)